jgi:hypothetical protein
MTRPSQNLRRAIVGFRYAAGLGVLLAVTGARADAGSEAKFHQAVAGFQNLPTEADHARFGQKAYADAIAFATTNNVPYFETTTSNGQRRVVMNVAGEDKVKAYMKAFSPAKGYMENFFSASTHDEPHWSYCRIGPRLHKQYGAGDAYKANLDYDSVRTAFPYAGSKIEIAMRVKAIRKTPNPPFDTTPPHVGGIYQGRFQRNCTDWITSVAGSLTGVKTNAVLSHAGSLWNGGSARMTVQAFLTKMPIRDFGPSVLHKTW